MYVNLHIKKMHLIKSKLLKNHFPPNILHIKYNKLNYSNTAESFIKSMVTWLQETSNLIYS